FGAPSFDPDAFVGGGELDQRIGVWPKPCRCAVERIGMARDDRVCRVELNFGIAFLLDRDFGFAENVFSRCAGPWPRGDGFIDRGVVVFRFCAGHTGFAHATVLCVIPFGFDFGRECLLLFNRGFVLKLDKGFDTRARLELGRFRGEVPDVGGALSRVNHVAEFVFAVTARDVHAPTRATTVFSAREQSAYFFEVPVRRARATCVYLLIPSPFARVVFVARIDQYRICVCAGGTLDREHQRVPLDDHAQRYAGSKGIMRGRSEDHGDWTTGVQHPDRPRDAVLCQAGTFGQADFEEQLGGRALAPQARLQHQPESRGLEDRVDIQDT